MHYKLLIEGLTLKGNHPFFRRPGSWIGEGRIILSSSPEFIRYFTKWTVSPEENGKIMLKQVVELHGVQDNLANRFVFYPSESPKFRVTLENEVIGLIEGHGLIDENTVSWEFRGNPNFEGFEICRLEDNGDYMVHAEYISTSSHRTTIDGRIWLKGS